MSTPSGGGSSANKPGTVRVSAKPAAGAKKPPVAGRPSSGQGGKGGNRRPAPNFKVTPQRNWTQISIIAVVIAFAAALIGYAVYQINAKGPDWQAKADGIPGIVDYRKTDPAMLTRNHVETVVQYPVSPPVGGNHNPNYQRCMGDVYTAPIANENAVHSLEHGSVWITYQPSLPQAQIDALKAKVVGNDFMLMSPYPGLDKPISLQAWGFQLKVDDASDPRIDQFITDLRQNATMEPGVPCSSGTYVTATGTTPHNLDGTNPTAAPVSPSAAPSSTPSSPAASPSQ